MPRADSSKTNKSPRDAEISGNEDGITSPHAGRSMIGPAPLVPAHREILREARSTVVRPYIPTTAILTQSLGRLITRASTSLLPNQEPQPEPQQDSQPEPQPEPQLVEWSHSRVLVVDASLPGPSNAVPIELNDPTVCPFLTLQF